MPKAPRVRRPASTREAKERGEARRKEGQTFRTQPRRAPAPSPVFTSIGAIMAKEPVIVEPEVEFLKDHKLPMWRDVERKPAELSFGGNDAASFGTFDARGNMVRNNTEEIYWAAVKELTPKSKKGARLRPFQSGEYWTLVSCMSSCLVDGFSRACSLRMIAWWAQGAMLVARGWAMRGMVISPFGWYLITGVEAELAAVTIKSVAYMDVYVSDDQVFRSAECAGFCGVMTVDDEGKPVKFEKAVPGKRLRDYLPSDVAQESRSLTPPSHPVSLA